jgi:hypothetical protein
MASGVYKMIVQHNFFEQTPVRSLGWCLHMVNSTALEKSYQKFLLSGRLISRCFQAGLASGDIYTGVYEMIVQQNFFSTFPIFASSVIAAVSAHGKFHSP